MNFNTHSALQGKHAFLSASKYHWINYDFDKLEATFRTAMAAQRGTELHAFACEAIRLGIRLPRSNKTLNAYVNDALGYRMTPEQTLFYSMNCFGTPDTIAFRRDTLRIHDLKTGVNKASFHQLEVYAAMFCLEYDYVPFEIDIFLRIYQNDEVFYHTPESEEIARIMAQIISFDKYINKMREEDQ